MSTATLTVPTSRVRDGIVAAALALGSLTVVILLIFADGLPDKHFTYADVAPGRDATWAALLVDGLGFAVAGIALALAVAQLARSRGAAWANTGAILAIVGGLAFCAAEFGYGVLIWYATALPAGTGGQLITQMQDNPGHIRGVQVAAFLAYNLGVLLLCVALWRAGTVPRWLPIAIAVLTLAQFAMPSALGRIEEAVTMLSFVPVGWYLMRGLP
jgi:hypothetical protein